MAAQQGRRAEPRLVVGAGADLGAATTRSHLPDGRCVGLVDASGDWVVDAELDVVPPPALAARFGGDRFWERWTRAECAAKLADVPIALWLSRHGLAEPDPARFALTTRRLEHPGRDRPGPVLVVSTGTSVGIASAPET